MAVVLVTGCSSGFGLLTAIEFAKQGDRVFAGVRTVSSAGLLAAEAAAANVDVTIVPVDVTDVASVERCVATVLEDAGRVDVLVNNAGIAAFAAVEDTHDDSARIVMETNFMGPLRMVRSVLPAMRANGHGRIVMVSSANGITGVPFTGVYSASKFALEALAGEVGQVGIGVAIVQPGAYHTAIDDKILDVAPSTAFPGVAGMVATMRNSMASDRPQDVAVAIVEAARGDASFTRIQIGADAERLYRARREMDDGSLAANLLGILAGA